MFTRWVHAAERLGRHLPSQCAICRSWQEARICGDCLQRFAPARWRCQSCALPAPEGQARCGRCVTHPPAFERAVAAWDHVYPWQELVERFKFHDALDLADALAQQLHAALRRQEPPVQVDCIVPVPLAPARLAERGYNQAWELARRLGVLLGCPARSDLLQRQRETPSQVGLDLSQRLRNLRGAFAVPIPRRAALQGLRVAVVDDVMTTGATMSAVAQALRAAGARSVQAWVLTRTPSPRD
ncbi:MULTISPECIES: ComF family protein [Caldimonas]|uniref:ComF family protein n=1 Tax=Caldimonas TaxID=196013 RepID=UPI00035EE6A2|nr:ComF family protein [Caldimonas manganoxidans]MCX7660626.1 ComF family protein [Caldimonas manganoxidans]